MKTRRLLLLLLIVAAVFVPGRSFSQPPPPPPPVDTDAPLDGGLSILLATGAAYGIKKVRDARKKKSRDTEA